MTYTTLISANTLQQQIDRPDWIIVDCRFALANSEAGGIAYRLGHLPHAHYAHLNNELSSAVTTLTGRHPLPDVTRLASTLGAWGIGDASQVVVYDDAGGAFAGRLWWLLRCFGHEQVAVLDGGIQQWQQQGHALTTALPEVKPVPFSPHLKAACWLSTTQVQDSLAKKSICLIDARTPERYRGEQEPIDPIAGHIPGALNRPFQLNLDKQGLFLPANQIADQFKQLIGTHSPEQVVHYCGSGVTACHNLLAMEHAGLKGSKLYAGAWSEWIIDKSRPIAVG